MLKLLYCVSDIIFITPFALHIVKSLIFIDFLLVEKTSKMSLTHKITDVPNSQNTFKTQFLLKILIQYALAFNFKCQQENMQIPSCSLLQMW